MPRIINLPPQTTPSFNLATAYLPILVGSVTRRIAVDVLNQTITGSSGVTDHSQLSNLDYAASGHTGFESSVNAQFVSQSIVTDTIALRLGINTTGSVLEAHVADMLIHYPSGSIDHAALQNLSYALSGHTGFESQDNAQFVSSSIIQRISNISGSNIGTTGTGWYDSMLGEVLQFKNIVATSPLGLFENVINKTVTIFLNATYVLDSDFQPFSSSVAAHVDNLTIHYPSGSIDHSKLQFLDYASSGHIGFESQANTQFVSGNLVTRIDNITGSLTSDHAGLTNLGYTESLHTGFESQVNAQFVSQSIATEKANTIHTHIISDVISLQTALDGKQAVLGFTPANVSAINAFSAGQRITGDLQVTGSVYSSVGFVGNGSLLTNVTGSLTKDHAGLTNLAYNESGHIGFAGLAVINQFTTDQNISGSVRMSGFMMPTSPTNGFVLTSNTAGVGSWQAPATGSGGVSDGDKGDIIVSGGGTVWTIDAAVVTEAKQVLADNTTQDVSTARHGYTPKAPNDTTKFLRGDATWAAIGAVYNQSTAQQGAGFAADTYLIGSSIAIPASSLKIGTRYHLVFNATKTAAGTATPILIVRFGTNGSTADTARLTFTFTAQTGVTDTGTFEIWITFRAVGAAAVMQGVAQRRHGASITGFGTLVAQSLAVTSGTFDSAVANSILGVSVNGGASAAWTVQLVQAELQNLV